MTPIRRFSSGFQVGRAIALRRRVFPHSDSTVMLDTIIKSFDEKNMMYDPRVEEILRKLEYLHLPPEQKK
jgi:hypothetical protein